MCMQDTRMEALALMITRSKKTLQLYRKVSSIAPFQSPLSCQSPIPESKVLPCVWNNA